MKRCFGKEVNIKDCDWSYLATLRTVRPPHEPLARRQDLLELFSDPKWQDIWLVLDIKVLRLAHRSNSTSHTNQIDDDPEEMMLRLADTFKRVSPGSNSAWKDKIVLGYWTVTLSHLPPTVKASRHTDRYQASFVPLCAKHLPGFPIMNIGFSTAYSRQFCAIPNTGFNILQPTLVSPAGRSFVWDLQARRHPVYAWTVNDAKNMDWCIRRGVDGIFTDDVPRLQEMCATFDEKKMEGRWPAKILLQYAVLCVWVFLFDIIVFERYGTRIKKKSW